MAKTDPGADDIVKEAREAFAIAQDAESENRQCAKEDIEFARLGKQWDQKVENERRLAGRPSLTINKLQAVIRQVVNDSRQNRPATKVHPVDSNADPETADILGGIIRNIEASSDADVAYDTAVDSAISGGFGYWRVNTDYALNAVDEKNIASIGASAFEQDIFIRRVANPFCIYGDPYSSAADSSDWMSAHVIDVLTRDQFEVKYPNAADTDFDGAGWHGIGAPWKEGDCVQVAEYWKREKVIRKAAMLQLADPEGGVGGTIIMFADDPQLKVFVEAGASVIGERPVSSFNVTQYIVNGVEVLDTVKWPGAYIPIVPVYGDEVNIEGKRHWRSLIRDAKDAQRMFNYWRTTATEVVALAPRAPWLIEEDAIPKGEVQKWATANSQSHAYLKYKKGAQVPQRQPFTGVPAGMLQEALNASDDIKAITGIYDASLGARSNETSGRAILMRQREGDVSTFHFIDNLTRAIRHSGRVLVDLIPKVYSTERMVRILGEDGKADTVKINAQAEGLERVHDVRIGRYDVTVTSGPSFTTRREEAAEQMMNLIQAYPDAAPIIGDLLAKNLDWPGADEIAKRLEMMLPPQLKDDQSQVPPEVQNQLQQMGQAIQVLGGQLKEASDKKDIEQQKLAIEQYKAVTDRIAAVPAVDQIRAVVMSVIQDVIGSVSPSELPDAEVAPAGPGAFAQPAMGQAA